MSEAHPEGNAFRVDRSAFSVTSLEEQDAETRAYWHSKTPLERLRALELTRQIVYGYSPDACRLQRVFEVVERT